MSVPLPDDVDGAGPDLGVLAHDGDAGRKRAVYTEDDTFSPWGKDCEVTVH